MSFREKKKLENMPLLGKWDSANSRNQQNPYQIQNQAINSQNPSQRLWQMQREIKDV